MDDVQQRNREILDAIQIRRDAFYEATLALEQALAAPSGGRPAAWSTALRGPVSELRIVLEAHITGTEGPDGLFAEIHAETPRLIHAADKLQSEHDPLRATTDALAASLGSITENTDVDAAREAGVELIRRLLLHRHRGAELLYDAEWLDVPAAD